MEHVASVEEFNKIKETETAVFLFSADWCPDCRVIEPFLPRLEVDYPTFTFYYVDRDKLLDVCIAHDIFGIPSFLAFSEGKEVARFVSKDRKTEEEIQTFLTEAETKVG
ncbi:MULTISPECIES: thioredoxin family protein [Shouchella]|uniref:Thioredoxin family protein n=2 Tax=Shouchella TaxID=2893057 RepID=A0ABY7W5Q5_9BACI|nr:MULTISPECIES: thioredoxin family protein [Shouchella]MED4130758.1 thioredoxin family protein [Shouchella miscanthi]WDF04253.1 thioredoxin family protein [Shouchella hunanensis]GAF21230.1 thioredoxin [Bacillus sp. JCM 19047]